MLKNNTAWLKCKKDLHVHNINNTSHGTVNKKLPKRGFWKYFCVFLLLQMLLHVTMDKEPDEGLEAEYTKQF
jgi:hypothetical protein